MATESSTDAPASSDPSLSAPSVGEGDIEVGAPSEGETDIVSEARRAREKKEKKERRRQLKKSALLKAEIAATLKAREVLLKSPAHRLAKLKAEEAERVREEEEEARIAESKRLAEAKAAEEARIVREAKAERLRIENEEKARKQKFATIKAEQEALVQARHDQTLKSRLDLQRNKGRPEHRKLQSNTEKTEQINHAKINMFSVFCLYSLPHKAILNSAHTVSKNHNSYR